MKTGDIGLSEGLIYWLDNDVFRCRVRPIHWLNDWLLWLKYERDMDVRVIRDGFWTSTISESSKTTKVSDLTMWTRPQPLCGVVGRRSVPVGASALSALPGRFRRVVFHAGQDTASRRPADQGGVAL